MKYTTLPYDNSLTHGLQRYIVDKDTDINELPTNCSVGSKAIVAESGNTYLLNNQHKWKKQMAGGNSNSGNISADFDIISTFLEPIGETQHIIYTCDGYGFGDAGQTLGLLAKFDDEFKENNYDIYPNNIRMIKDVNIYINGELYAKSNPNKIIPLYPDNSTTDIICHSLNSDGSINLNSNSAYGFVSDEFSTPDEYIRGFALSAFPEESFAKDTIIDIPSVPLYKFKDSFGLFMQLTWIYND